MAACLLGTAYIFSFALILSTLFIALMNVTLQRVSGGYRWHGGEGEGTGTVGRARVLAPVGTLQAFARVM